MLLILDNLQTSGVKFYLYKLQPWQKVAEKIYLSNDLLKNLTDFLAEKKINFPEIQYFGIVEGKGSFTGIRNAANLANSFWLYFETRVFGLDVKDLQEKKLEKKIAQIFKKSLPAYSPKYSSYPKITQQKFS